MDDEHGHVKLLNDKPSLKHPFKN